MARGDYDDLDLVMDQGIEMVKFYRENPCIAAYDLLNVDLVGIQRLVFEDMWFRNYVIAVCSRGFGKTFLLGTLACLSCLLYPGYRVGLIAPVFRQSKLIFSEVEKLYARSPILQEAAEKKPIRGPDTCYLKLKPMGVINGSYIEALPLGDGSKIRGSRFYLIVVDELAQVPDKILDMVVRPMAATTLEPAENVRRRQRQERLREMGLLAEEDMEESTVNKMVMTSSGYFKFNHMWRRMKDYWGQIEEKGNKAQHAVWQVPYWDLPEGFLDKNSVSEAKRVMSNAEYRMEYEAAMIADSEGFFKASLLEACTRGSDFNIELKGDPAANYVIGVDPNQGGDASCGVVVIKMGQINQVVNVFELKKKTTQELTKAVQDLCDTFNVTRIFMDRGGGGKAICDLLEDGYNGYEPLIDRTNEDHKYMKGRQILEMVNFNPSWISDANFTTLSLLEDGRLRFPDTPVKSTLDSVGKTYESIQSLKSQMLNIIVTQTATGVLHFDTPKKGQNKDLYSAIILAAHGVRMIEKELEDDGEPILYNSSGMIRPHESSGTWNPVNKNSGPIQAQTGGGLHLAVLKKRIK